MLSKIIHDSSQINSFLNPVETRQEDFRISENRTKPEKITFADPKWDQIDILMKL